MDAKLICVKCRRLGMDIEIADLRETSVREIRNGFLPFGLIVSGEEAKGKVAMCLFEAMV